MFDPIIRGWIQYYGRFYRSGLYPLRWYLNGVLARWATRKYKKLRHHFGERSSGSCASLGAIHSSLLTGNLVRSVALQREPYELRGW